MWLTCCGRQKDSDFRFSWPSSIGALEVLVVCINRNKMQFDVAVGVLFPFHIDRLGEGKTNCQER